MAARTVLLPDEYDGEYRYSRLTPHPTPTMKSHDHSQGDPPMNARPLRTLTRLTFANPASLAYLAVVGVALVVAASEPLYSDVSGSMIWVWPAMLTLPAYVPIAALGAAVMGESMPGLFVGSIVLAALVQSLALGALFESLRGRLTRPGNLRA